MSERSFVVENLGKANLASPIALPAADYLTDEKRVLREPTLDGFRAATAAKSDPESFELAGPRQKILFNPTRAKAAIVTCGGLCPGINAVIRALVMQLWHRYGVKNIIGVRYGYHGLGENAKDDFVNLVPDMVEGAHEQGGTILGSSRGSPTTSEIVDTLASSNINMLFTIGGDGTMRGALAIAEEIKTRNLKISVIGIPKTIDNDIPYVKRSFGFESAVAIACEAIRSAHLEAVGVRRGVGLVKLMGRHSGYISANATLAAGHTNFCLIPEVNFTLEGNGGLLELIDRRLSSRGHCVIVLAEGAGQYYFEGKPIEHDDSGNAKLGDIGVLLKQKLQEYFRGKKAPIALKYIDPSYLIRSAPANPADSLFCNRLAHNAVHAAMAGKTGLLIGYWHGRMTHVPMQSLTGHRQTINPNGELWFNVLESTGQPSLIGDMSLVKSS